MRIITLGLILIASLLFQSTFPNWASLWGSKPDFLLIVIIYSALNNGAAPAARIGFAFGLAEDLFSGQYLGFNIFTKTLTGYLVGLGERKLYKDNLLVPVVAVFTGTIFNQVMGTFLLSFAGKQGFFPLAVWSIVPLAVYNSLLVPLTYGFFYRSSHSGWLNLPRFISGGRQSG
ncbi:MAG: rod shape-determining protein MreD [Bacillota bacterium]